MFSKHILKPSAKERNGAGQRAATASADIFTIQMVFEPFLGKYALEMDNGGEERTKNERKYSLHTKINNFAELCFHFIFNFLLVMAPGQRPSAIYLFIKMQASFHLEFDLSK